MEFHNFNPDIKYTRIDNRQDVLMRSLSKFFLDKNNIEQVIPVIEGKSKISLRILDWFCTNYAKKNNINYTINTGTGDKQIIVYLNYKAQLKAYQKKQFDPFCRRERIKFYYNKSSYITTTVGQLNFFRWSIQTNIINYIVKNLEQIEKDMNNSMKLQYANSNNVKNGIKIRKKRKELSISATRTVNKHKINIEISFN